MRCFIGLILLVSSLQLQAKVSARVDRTEVTMGESFTLEITIGETSTVAPDLSVLEPVFQVAHTNQRSFTQNVNGQISRETIWQVVLFPQSVGDHVIPPIEINGEFTQALSIKVVKPDPAAQGGGDFFIEIEPSKTEAYVQEEIGLIVRLFYRVTPRNASLSEPVGDGLIVQPVNKSVQYQVQRNGSNYNVLERRYALYSENSGKATLNPIVFNGEVADGQRQSFSMFQRGRPVRFISDMLEFNIKSIPQSFIGKPWIPAELVELKQSWSQSNSYKAGEPITRTVELTVKGLSENQLPDLIMPDIEGAKIYADTADTLGQQDGKSLISTKTMKFAVIPNAAGMLEIPEYKLAWFDTVNQQMQFATLSAESIPISASAIEVSAQPVEPVVNEQARVNGADMSGDLIPESINLWRSSPWMWISFGLALLWLSTVTSWYFTRRRTTSVSNVVADKVSVLDDKQLRLQLQSSDPAILQQALILWWNRQHAQQVTNLSSIAEQMHDISTAQALLQLQASLYQPSQEQPQTNWLKLIKSGGFKQQSSGAKTNSQELPPLYQ
ncbi:BatD family protein [Marinicella sp. W31]|uniref:BatD family protein n=1 Tax=Marinicella sp. W31 TaxID=3023713 RepID=UPI00375792F1